jgi:hypothetical protein
MWIFTKKGFVSAVQHEDDSRLMVVRARAERHLVALFPDEHIIELAHTDYPYRVHITRQEFVEWATAQAEAIDYTDFKSSLTDPKYKAVCSEIWSVAHDLQGPEAHRYPGPDDDWKEDHLTSDD